MSNNNSSSGGIGFFGLLTIVFIVLKLTKYIDWSWWWVTCPLWGPLAAVLLFLVIKLALSFATSALADKATKAKRKEQINRIIEDQKKNAGKSKWQIRMEEMQKAQKLRENK